MHTSCYTGWKMEKHLPLNKENQKLFFIHHLLVLGLSFFYLTFKGFHIVIIPFTMNEREKGKKYKTRTDGSCWMNVKKI